jgi:hypothetical protein
VPDLSGLPALDVAIGLAFVYFVLSIVCSAVNEAIAATFRLRAQDLERGLRSIIRDEDALQAFYRNPRIKALYQRIRWPNIPDRKPSYIPPRTFALALVDTVSPPPAEATDSHDLLKRSKEVVDKLSDGPLKQMLADAIADTRDDLGAFTKSVERSFDEVMDRVSGWYKRRVQWILLVVALVIVGAANVDSFAIGQRLFQDDAVRSAVVARAGDQASAVSCEANGQAAESLDEVADCVAGIADLGLPLGWSDDTAPDTPEGSAFKALGLLITALALTLGAPFWFDALGKLARLRGTGNREGTQKDDDRAPSDRDERRTG